MAHRPVAATLASRADQPLSPPHSDHSSGKEVDRESDDNKPMDLSSGGPVSGVTNLFGRGFCETMPISDHPLLNARRLAELVRQQHFESEEREREGKRKWDDHDEDEENQENNEVTDNRQNLIPLHLIRAKWEGAAMSPERNDSSPELMQNRGDRSPELPGSPAGSSSGSESGREEKRRRLDMLLNKKFDKVTSVENSNPISHSTPPPSESSLPSDSQIDRRPSLDLGGPLRINRRKQAHPSNPNSPPSLTIRPNSDLFPPVATSTPRDHRDESHGTRVPTSCSRPSSPIEPQDYSPVRKMSRPQSPVLNPRSRSPVQPMTEEKDNKDAIKKQILQMQLAGSGLLSGLGGNPPPELLKTLQYNPILYYSYYAQMLSALQTQQKLLELNTTPPTVPSPTNNNNNIKDLLSPLRLGGLASLNKESLQDSRSMFSPHYQQHGQSPASTLSPGGYKDDEPRKRAPRALTGRYVRTGTAASPRVLQILRKKVEDRLKLKELLGENSHLYFGAMNKQQNQYKPLNQKIKKKF